MTSFLALEPSHPNEINLSIMDFIPTWPHGPVVARSLRDIEAQFTVAMVHAYDYKIGHFDL